MSPERKCSCGGIDIGVGVMHEPICELNDEGWIHKLEEDIKDLESRGSSGRTVFVVTRHKGVTPEGDHLFEIQGVFTTEEKAIAACRGENYGYGPEVLDQELPHESTVWPGYRYPHTTSMECAVEKPVRMDECEKCGRIFPTQGRDPAYEGPALCFDCNQEELRDKGVVD